jgi:prepilin-type N-terminal cleavage/methylation domain-containing protein
MVRSKRYAFTLVELLIVIAIIAVLVALFVPATRRVRESAARSQIANNLKQVAIAVHTYHDAYKQLPPATGPAVTDSASVGRNLPLSIHLLRFLEKNPLFGEYETGKTVTLEQIVPYCAPLDPSASDWIGVQNFAGNVRVFTDIGIKTPFDAEVLGLNAGNGTCTGTWQTYTHGSSNTIVFATRYANNGTISGNGKVNCSAYDAPLGAGNSAFFGALPMTTPASAVSSNGWQLAPSLTEADCHCGAVAHSFDSSGLQIATADASVRSISSTMSAFTWNTVMQPNDGHEMGSDW